MPPLAYRIDATRPASHRLDVRLELDLRALRALGAATAEECVLFLPTWTPGSYLIREYSRHLGRVTASDIGGAALACRKVAKNRVAIALAPGMESVEVRYSVYAHELSVRTADVTAAHAYWNHACLLLWPLGARRAGARIEIQHPSNWQVACALPAEPAEPGRTTLVAADLDEAVDSPCLVGVFERLEWEVGGVRHAIVLDGLDGVRPPDTLVADLTRIVEHAAAVFGVGLPYRAYTFLALFAAEGHGGLEHASSTTLLAARTSLAEPKQYREFLGLAAHELFHAWNVKRLRPVEFWEYDYEQENYSQLLWLMEGWTAYYDDLLCHRAGLLPRDEYLGVVAKNVNAMLSAPGRLHLSLSESSYDAWIRLYRPDENTRNSSQNYYGNGAVAAMCLDLMLRRATRGASCLDDVLRRLYETTFAQGRGYSRSDVAAIVCELAGEEVAAAHAGLVDGALDPDLDTLLGDFGVRLRMADNSKPYLGVSFRSGSTTLSAVTLDSPASRAGIAAGDEVLAIGNLRVDSGNWQEVFAALARIDQELEVLLARRGVIHRVTAKPSAAPGTVALELLAQPTTEQLRLRDAWLTPPAAAGS